MRSFMDLLRLTYGRLLSYFDSFGLLWQVISPSRSVYLHTKAQRRKKKTNTNTMSGIRTCGPIFRATRAHAQDCATTVSGTKSSYGDKINAKEIGWAGSTQGGGRLKMRTDVPENKRPLVRTRFRLDNCVPFGLKEIGCGCVNEFIQLRSGSIGGLSWAR